MSLTLLKRLEMKGTKNSRRRRGSVNKSGSSAERGAGTTILEIEWRITHLRYASDKPTNLGDYTFHKHQQASERDRA